TRSKMAKMADGSIAFRPKAIGSNPKHFLNISEKQGTDMGGYGSGMWRVSRRPLAETMRRIDLTTFRRDEPSLTAGPVLQVRCQRSDGEKVGVANVYIESERMHFGARRLWFRCPRCDNRCRVLYGTWRIACLRCHRLRYLSQRETKEDRATRAMLKIVRRL